MMQQILACRNIGHNIMAFDKYFRIFLKNSLKVYDHTAAEGMILLALYGQDSRTEGQIFESIHQNGPETTQDQLVHELHYDKSVMTRTMQSLEGKGYVVRSGNPKDSRSFLFGLTEAGSAFKTVLMNIMTAWNDAVLEGFTAAEIGLMSDMLARLAQNAQKTNIRREK